MDAMRRLDIELPEEMVEAVNARVSSGRFASPSAVIQEGLRLLAEEEEPLEEWLAQELAAGYDAWKSNPEAVYTVDEVRTRLREQRAQRQR